MPVIETSTFRRPRFFFNGHYETIYASIYRKVPSLPFRRERIATRDNDFLDIDWLQGGSGSLAIIGHGLEGHSRRNYMRGMARALAGRSYDVLSWNNRSCSGEMNKALRLYHHADTDDLEDVILHAVRNFDYNKIVLVGFSMGGSQIIKYLGTADGKLPEQVKGAVTYSVPCNLADSAASLSLFSNSFYRKKFLEKLKEKIRIKQKMFPGEVDLKGIDEIRDFETFDNRFTAPIHGFEDAQSFYRAGSAENYIPKLNVPVLLVNAGNDPMLAPSSYPFGLARDHACFYLEVPKKGGHVGFFNGNHDEIWSESRALEFFDEHIH